MALTDVPISDAISLLVLCYLETGLVQLQNWIMLAT